MKQLKIGIAPFEEQQRRTLDIVAGKMKRPEGDPKVWFPSLSEAMRILSDDNLAVLKCIRERHPASVGELAEVMGKTKQDVAQSIQLMSQIGLVRLETDHHDPKPEAMIDHILIALP